MRFAETKRLIINWKRIHLSLICTSVCKTKMDGRFIEEVYKRFETFDNIQDLKWLIDTIRSRSTENKTELETKDILQYLYQIFVTDFAFVNDEKTIQRNQEAAIQRIQFVQKLIDVCSKEISTDDNDNKTNEDDNEISLQLNPFSKLQTLSRILHLTRDTIDEKKDEKEEESKESQDVRIRLGQKVNDMAQHENIDELPLTLYLLSCEEQYLHYRYKTENEGKPITKIPLKTVESVVQRLNESFDSTKLNQLLAIADAKLIVYYFVRFVSSVLKKKGAKFTDKGLMFRKQKAISMKYLQALGKLFKIPEKCENDNLISIKKGFQYFILSALWNSVLGPTRTIKLANNDNFPTVLNIDVMIAMKDAPEDNPFKLLKAHNGDDDDASIIFDGIENAIIFKNNIINWKNDLKYVVFVVGSLFNHGYIKKGIVDNYLTVILQLVQNLSQTISQQHLNENDDIDIGIRRINRLFTTLACNSMHEKLQFNKKRNEEDIQLTRMMYHLVGTILSVPKSPFSTLFHNPLTYNNGYLVGMPEDAASQIFKFMVGYGVWLCPDGHMYFIANCTWPNQSSKCDTCGKPTGKKEGGGFHEAAPGNKRIGKVDENGKIQPITIDPYTKKEYKDEDLGEYDAKQATPKGYIDVGKASDTCRNLDDITIRVIRLFVNVIMLMHHAVDEELSKLKNFPSLQTLPDYNEIYAKLIGYVKQYTNEIGEKLGIRSMEDTLYVIHNIINEFYETYPKWIANDEHKNVNNILQIEHRMKFEQFLTQCIKPTMNNVNTTIQDVRNKCSNELMIYWSHRVAETIELQTHDGIKFSRNFRPNLFLQFRFVTLRQFQTIMLSLSDDKKNELKQLYPITYGILECINLNIGYSVFALKYLPSMITWMKNIQSRLNQRIELEDVQKNPDKYNGQWVLDQCEKYQWGDIKEWEKALKGFAAGWNHVASRVTTDRQKKNKIIAPATPATRQQSTNVDDHEEWKDDEKENILLKNKKKKRKKRKQQNKKRKNKKAQNKKTTKRKKKIKKQENKQENKQQKEETKSSDDNDDIDELIRHHNPFRKYVVLNDVCQLLTILKIEPKSTDKKKIITPSDIPLSFALDSDSDEFTSSKMVRFMLQHLVEANNRLLRICYNLSAEDNGETIGLSPRLSTKELSQQRINDVINIDEEELTALIQQCAKPRLKYGEDNDLDINSFNLRLLETKLRQKYIVNRKFLKYERVTFEFAGQHNIPNLINEINSKYKSQRRQKISYFNETAEVPQNLILLKFAIEQNCEYVDDDIDEKKNENYDEIDEKEEKERKEKVSKMRGYNTSIQAIEQTLIALSRLENYPDPNTNLISDYMKNTLHLYAKDYTPFQQTKLKLQHINTCWRYLEKLYMLCEGKWTEIPNNVMPSYLEFINNDQETLIEQFVASKDMNALWVFLGGMRRFMQRNCKTKTANFIPNEKYLADWLGSADDIEPEMMDDFLPDDLMLSQIGYAYSKAAEEYQNKLNDQQNNK